MVQIKWGPFRDKFHQYVLRNLSSIVTNPVQSKILNTSYATEWWTDFTADTSVSFSEQNILTVTAGPSIPDTTSQNYLTDDSFLTTEAWIYCGILAAVIAFLILAGVCHTINFIINHSNSPIQPTQEVPKRVNSPPAPSFSPLLSIRDQDSWAAPFNNLPPFQFSPQSPLFPKLASDSGLNKSSFYDHPHFQPKPIYQIVDILPLPKAPSPTRLGEAKFSSEEDFPPPTLPTNHGCLDSRG